LRKACRATEAGCKKLIEMMGGSISVESEWGVGSTFTLRLPLG
jgi:signal transduction histidine kinase